MLNLCSLRFYYGGFVKTSQTIAHSLLLQRFGSKLLFNPPVTLGWTSWQHQAPCNWVRGGFAPCTLAKLSSLLDPCLLPAPYPCQSHHSDPEKKQIQEEEVIYYTSLLVAEALGVNNEAFMKAWRHPLFHEGPQKTASVWENVPIKVKMVFFNVSCRPSTQQLNSM